MATVIIEGTGTSVLLAKGERVGPVQLTSIIERRIAKGYVVEIERFDDPAPTDHDATADNEHAQELQDLVVKIASGQDETPAAAADESPAPETEEPSSYASGGVVSGPTTMPSSLEQ